MKKIICILLCVLNIFLFSACFGNLNNSETISNQESLKAVDLKPLGDISLMSYDTDGRYIALLYYPAVLSDEEEQIDTFLSLYDMKKDKFIGKIQVLGESYRVMIEENAVKVWYTVEIDDENYSYDNYFEYDLKLNETESDKQEISDGYEKAENIDTIDVSRFSCNDSYASLTHYIYANITVFYQDPKTYYIETKQYNSDNQSSCPLASYDKTVLKKTDSAENQYITTLSVCDYENRKAVNELEFDGTENKRVISASIIDGNGVCFDTYCDETGFSDAVYYWNYRESPINRDFKLEIINDDDFDEKSAEIENSINDVYSINVEVNPDFHEIWWNDLKNADYLLCLYDLKYCLSTLPKEFYSELMCSDLENPITSFQKMNIFVVGELAEMKNADAYSFNENDNLYMVFDSSCFSVSNFYHEIMHSAVYRIWNYEYNFEENWEKLNPDNFQYDDNYTDVYFSNSEYENCFARDYSVKDCSEDIATTFEMVLSAKQQNQEKSWRDKEILNKKVEYLNTVLGKSYPSLTELMSEAI